MREVAVAVVAALDAQAIGVDRGGCRLAAGERREIALLDQLGDANLEGDVLEPRVGTAVQAAALEPVGCRREPDHRRLRPQPAQQSDQRHVPPLAGERDQVGLVDDQHIEWLGQPVLPDWRPIADQSFGRAPGRCASTA
jgi:hypothetical protein